MNNVFGRYIREHRLALGAENREFSVRKVAGRVGIEPSYLSKIERGQQPPPSEATIAKLAGELDEDRDILLAMAGKVSGDLLRIIQGRPKLFAELIRQLRNAPDNAVLHVIGEVRDGQW